MSNDTKTPSVNEQVRAIVEADATKQAEFESAWALVCEQSGDIVRMRGEQAHLRTVDGRQHLFDRGDIPALRAVIALLGG